MIWIIIAFVIFIVAAVIYRVSRRKKDKQLAVPKSEPPWKATAQLIMMIVVSLGVLGAMLYIIISGQHSDELQKVAFGMVGLIVGFWIPS